MAKAAAGRHQEIVEWMLNFMTANNITPNYNEALKLAARSGKQEIIQLIRYYISWSKYKSDLSNSLVDAVKHDQQENVDSTSRC